MLEIRSEYQEGSYWYYAPNKGAPVAFAILFAISGLIHIYQCIKYRSWKITGLFPWAALIFVGGYVTRALGAFGLWDNLPIYITSTVLLLAAPPVYEGANYLILGRILYYIPYHAPIHPGRVFTTFAAMGILIEVFTGNGAALVANSENSEAVQNAGRNLIKASLILQVALMVGFVAVALRFLHSCSRAGLLTARVRRPLFVLLVSCTLITIRTIYRTVEYFTATSLNILDLAHMSPILKDEWFFWVFEATVMFSNSILLNIFHPMRYLPRSNKIYLAPDGVTEVEGPGYDDARPFLLTLFDPFDLTGLILRKNRDVKYWEVSEPTKVQTDKVSSGLPNPV